MGEGKREGREAGEKAGNGNLHPMCCFSADRGSILHISAVRTQYVVQVLSMLLATGIIECMFPIGHSHLLLLLLLLLSPVNEQVGSVGLSGAAAPIGFHRLLLLWRRLVRVHHRRRRRMLLLLLNVGS